MGSKVNIYKFVWVLMTKDTGHQINLTVFNIIVRLD